MPSTLKQVVQEMCRRSTADSVGRSVAVTGLAAQTVTASSMATGTVSAQKFINKWLWRPDTATVGDRFRICSGYASATGVYTHVGAAYGDTTATGEDLLILEYEPQSILDAIQVTLERTRHIAATIIPTRTNEDRYPVSSLFSWIVDPKDVQRVALSGAPWLNNNRFMQRWSTYQSGGTLNPDFWTLGGASATVTRSSTYTRRGPYVAALARVGTDATLGQAFSLQLNGVAADDLVGETVFVVGVGLATAASRLRFAIVAGTTTGSTSYHTGGSTWEELSTSITVPTDATDITVRAEVNTGNTTAYIDELYALHTSAIANAHRRGYYAENPLRREDYHWEQFPGGIMLVLNTPLSRDQQLVFYSERPYPRFSQSRIDAGSGDLDSTDCPIEIVATGALARLHEGLSHRPGADGSKHARLAAEYEAEYEVMALAHKGAIIRSDEAPIPSPRLAAPAGRW